LDLDADEHQIDFPILYANARAAGPPRSRASRARTSSRSSRPSSRGSLPQLRPGHDAPGPGLQPRRLPLRRPPRNLSRSTTARSRRDRPSAGASSTATVVKTRSLSSYVSESLDRASMPTRPAQARSQPSPAWRDHLRRDAWPTRTARRPPPPSRFDEPSLTIDDRHQHVALAGTEGTKLTARLVKSRSTRGADRQRLTARGPTERPDAWEVQGRGRAQLAVLVETSSEVSSDRRQAPGRHPGVDGKAARTNGALAVDVPPRTTSAW